jgi:hypothetical protein
VRQAGEPLAHHSLDAPLIKLIEDRLQAPWILTVAEAVIQGLEGNARLL